jgi:UDP-2,3-diacylglucosamine hydrolase
MRAVFIADAHLLDPAEANYRALLDFLAEQEGCTDLLVLLGDICEFLAGYPHTVFPPYVPLMEALNRLQRGGTRLIYVEGNHDFHLEPGFRNRFPCQILPDGGTIELDGERILLAHGDLADPTNHGYRLMRGLLRGPLVRLLIRLLPVAATWWIGEHWSRSSRCRRNDKSRQKPARQILIPFARARLAEGARAVVTGHFHQPFHEQLETGELIALGDWITQYSYAVWEDGGFRLERYTPPAR